jgi:plastocyanin
MNLTVILILSIIGISSSTLIPNADAQIVANSAFSLEGAGFVVSEETIQTSQVELFFSTKQKSGTSTNFVVDDGIVSLTNDDFIATDLTGTLLRDGRFIRLQGTAENIAGEEVSLSFFGRLVESTKEGSVYGFTGRLTQDGEGKKIIYTTKISGFTKKVTTETPTKTTPTEITVRITKGSSDPSSISYIDRLGKANTIFDYFFPSRVSTQPGMTITFVNDDIVPHSVTSGAGLGQNSRYVTGSDKPFACEGVSAKSRDAGFSYIQQDCAFIIDGKIKSGQILPGEKWSVTINEMGFYRLVDVDYPWMDLVIYVFPKSSSVVVGIPDPDDARKN